MKYSTNLVLLAGTVCLIVLMSGCMGGQDNTTSTTQPAAATTLAGTFVAKASDIPPNTIRIFDYKGEQAILVNFGGSFQAYVNKCPHQNLPFNESSLTGDKITCPYHGAQFDPVSGKYLGNANGGNFGLKGLTTIALKVDSGNIYAQ